MVDRSWFWKMSQAERSPNMQQPKSQTRGRRPRSSRAAARGIGAAHRQGVCHLDVTPNNIMIDPAGRPRVIDFGLSRQRGWVSPSESDLLGGSLAYLSPEQTDDSADRLGTRTDVFGLGAVLYRLLTGIPPYSDGTPEELLVCAPHSCSGRASTRRAKHPGAAPTHLPSGSLPI